MNYESGNGYIKTSDLREILRALDDKLNNDELDEMIAEIDTDGSGTVDFDGRKQFVWLDKVDFSINSIRTFGWF